MIDSLQCKLARVTLEWTAAQLAQAANVGVATINRFEAGSARPIPATLAAIQRALEDAGIEFLPANGGEPSVRMRRLREGDLVRFRPQSTVRLNFDISPEEVGTVAWVEPHPPQSGPTYRVSVHFERDKTEGIFRHEFVIVRSRVDR